MKLIATYPILYCSHFFQIGDELPTADKEKVDAWLQAKTAVWQEETNKTAKAKIIAEAGLDGVAVNPETNENLAGKIPKTEVRKRNKK